MITRRTLLAGLSGLALAASGPARAQGAERMRVTATFSILADLVRQIAGDRVEVAALVGPDGDGHVYSPTPADARRLTASRIVVANGLGFEGWIDRLVRASGTKATIVEASRGVRTLKAADDHGQGHAHGSVDPHAWQDVVNVKLYVATIRDALIKADLPGADGYRARTDAYLAALDALDREIRDAIARLAPDRRRVITSHDSFAYFEAAYGLDFVAPQGVSTEAEASARDVARIIDQIRRERIPAVFLENVSDPRLVERIAKDTGAVTGGRLYSDALSGPDGPAPTYIDMMRHNIRAISQALSS
ncbi:metal ABC transporter substrate-binding protein [Salinarimonas soli]|uniref:Metal ABC transporter substrate-binding protein n=1 Tax=Salinarimonas soli TaxID=1638099 RepID=A0A5B2VD49_9HYPH|nr:metal ABC transporter substrate-binding protein [Salinarimonas soli]KAA2236685.1 metal ABC transporter substrate-binding protein [Salinarimonas soli]